MASIRKVGNRYQVQVRLKGINKSQTFTERSEAERWAHRTEAPYIRPGRSRTGLLTVGDVLAAYVELELPKHKSGAVEEYLLRHLRRHWISSIRCSQLTTMHLAQYRDERLGEVKANSVKRVFNLLRPMIDTARKEWGADFTSNPAREITVAMRDDSRSGRLTASQTDMLLTALRKRKNKQVAKVVELALETVMRRSELLSLTWNDIDLGQRIAYVRKSKNGMERVVALSPRAVEILLSIEKTTQKQVFTCSASAIRATFDRAKKEVGLDHWCFHQLRHEGISRLWEIGLNEVEISSMSGHRDWKMLRRYSHVDSIRLADRLRNHATGD